MASIHKQITLDASPDTVWDVVRDVGAVHTRFAPGFVTDTRMEGPDRRVTFANGMQVLELIVGVDDGRRRLAYSARSERLTHHNATFQVFAEGGGARLVWTADVLPGGAAANIEAMMDQGLAAAKAALERVPA